MTISEQGVNLIKSFEGCELKSYQDSKGIWTIGYGNTQYENGLSVKPNESVTQDRANILFASILSRFDSGVSNRIRTGLNQPQFDALVCFTYNVGFGSLDKSTLLKKVNADPNDTAIRDEFMKWVNKGSSFEKGLTRRRKAEADLYFS